MKISLLIVASLLAVSANASLRGVDTSSLTPRLLTDEHCSDLCTGKEQKYFSIDDNMCGAVCLSVSVTVVIIEVIILLTAPQGLLTLGGALSCVF